MVYTKCFIVQILMDLLKNEIPYTHDCPISVLVIDRGGQYNTPPPKEHNSVPVSRPLTAEALSGFEHSLLMSSFYSSLRVSVPRCQYLMLTDR